ncbi:MAG: hypothetical protein HOK81_06520 [Rhodospirillaceae bacterium]|nr:hypothetical protein [Rhodospirillaceae bacterium]
MATLIQAVLGALLAAIVEAIADWRRDRSLRRLGYSEAALDQARAGLAAAVRMGAVFPADRAGVLERLRDGRF